MSDYQMKATILLILENNNISFMHELRKFLKNNNRLDLIILLDEDRSFCNRVRNYLFNKRLGVISHV